MKDFVIPGPQKAEPGIQFLHFTSKIKNWIPAFAGMTS